MGRMAYTPLQRESALSAEMIEGLRTAPRGAALPELVDWVRSFIGREFQWELELRIKAESAPPAVLGGEQQLGWSGWLGRSPDGTPVTGMCFEPEEYVGRGARESVWNPYQ